MKLQLSSKIDKERENTHTNRNKLMKKKEEKWIEIKEEKDNSKVILG